MITDQDLLKKAWPEGYLAIPDLVTIHGWRCLCAPDKAGLVLWIGVEIHEGDVAWCEPILTVNRDGKLKNVSCGGSIEHAFDHGEFLPIVDRAVPGSWFLLLQYLAGLLGMRLEGSTGIAWRHFPREYDGDRWELQVSYADGYQFDRRVFAHSASPSEKRIDAPEVSEVNVNEPELALVLAIAHVRENSTK